MEQGSGNTGPWSLAHIQTCVSRIKNVVTKIAKQDLKCKTEDDEPSNVWSHPFSSVLYS
jgi:hypothetical protein